MKQKHGIDGQSGFWVKLIGVLVAVGILVVLVFSGFQNVLSQVTALQRQLDTKSIEFDVVSGQLAEANRELGVTSSELDATRSELVAMTGKFESLRITAADSASDLAEAKSELMARERKLIEKSEALDFAEGELLRVKGELAANVSELSRLKSELQTATSQLNLKSEELETLREEFSAASAIARRLEVDDLIELLPHSMKVGSLKWVRDNGRMDVELEVCCSATGKRIYYQDKMFGGKLSVSVTAYDTYGQARASFSQALDSYSELRPGASVASFPEPNYFSSVRNSAISIFQIDNYVLELNIDFYGGNPVLHLSREVIRYIEKLQSELDK